METPITEAQAINNEILECMNDRNMRLAVRQREARKHLRELLEVIPDISTLLTDFSESVTACGQLTPSEYPTEDNPARQVAALMQYGEISKLSISINALLEMVTDNLMNLEASIIKPR